MPFNECPRAFACFPQFVHNQFSSIFAILSKKTDYTYMSIIQKIRDKASLARVWLIAVSLIGFLLMDARSIGAVRQLLPPVQSTGEW